MQEASKFFTEFNASHDGGELHLEVLSSGVITEEEISWLVEKQQQFTRLEEATALRLGRLLDRGNVQMGCRLRSSQPSRKGHQQLTCEEWIEPLGRCRHMPSLG